MNRRTFLIGSLFAPTASAIEFGKELKSGDVSIVIDQADSEDQLFIGVNTANEWADHALVEVFYRTTREIEGKPVRLLVREESVAPLAEGIFGATDRNFNIRKRDVEFVRVTLFQTVGEAREFR